MEIIRITAVGSTRNELQEIAVPSPGEGKSCSSVGNKRKPSFKEKQEYDKLQEEIESLEKQKETLTTAISSGSTDHQQLQKWSQEIQNITDEIEQKTLRWLELDEIM